MPIARRHKRYSLKAEINVVPYIDVMLVLLIIFMVTTPMLNSNVDVNLPQADAKALQGKKNPIVVSVKQDGSLLLSKDGSRAEPIDEDTLKNEMAAFVRVNPDINVLVGGDREGNYGNVFKVLTDLQQAGVSKVGLMGQPGDSAGHGRESHGRK